MSFALFISHNSYLFLDENLWVKNIQSSEPMYQQLLQTFSDEHENLALTI